MREVRAPAHWRSCQASQQSLTFREELSPDVTGDQGRRTYGKALALQRELHRASECLGSSGARRGEPQATAVCEVNAFARNGGELVDLCLRRNPQI